jgi:tRNA A-37 threonylcarbamoyl transferase component Bud32/SAM-dependent methyltransferase
MRLYSPYTRVLRRVAEFQRRRTADADLARWRAMREEVVEAAHLPARSVLAGDQLDRLRASHRGAGETIVADIDQDGFLLSHVGPLPGLPTVSPDRFIPRKRYELRLVVIDGALGVKKYFRGDVSAFVAELAAGHDLRRAGCRVPVILDVDFDALTITFDYLPGPVLREELAKGGAILRDRDVAAHPEIRKLRRRQRRDRCIEEGRAVLDRVLDADAIERLFAELKAVHAAGYVLHDLKFGNIILDPPSGEPYFIDFDQARSYPDVSRLAFRFLRDQDYEKFNAHFGTRKPTQRRVRAWGRGGDARLERLYAPLYFAGGLRFGPVWSINAGYGRWRYILHDHLPPLPGARVLDLGANNGFNALQMMRAGAREVVAVEHDPAAVAQGRFVAALFEWADNRAYPLTYVGESMERLPQLALGRFDVVTALCSIYYLDDQEIRTLIRHISSISDVLVLQCNTDRRLHRSDPRTFEKASVEYATAALRCNGFPSIRLVAPRGYSRPMLIGTRGGA